MKHRRTRKIPLVAIITLLVALMLSFTVFAEGDAATANNMFMGTFWGLVPPVVAIALALITKEVYSSLFVGIFVGGLFFANFNLEGTINHIFQDGMISVLSDGYNVGILIFLVILGAMVGLMNKAGGSAAFGAWAGKKIKTRKGAQYATIGLGSLIFIDDYFNCLTVGSVMRPVTDSHNISRAKLSYLIDSTAAPICIIAPISSWAAAVSGFVADGKGLTLFIQAIPYNFYALLTITTMLAITFFDVDFGPMAPHEENAKNGDIFTTPGRPYANAALDTPDGAKGKVIDLIFPILSLVVFCVCGMIYTGGFFSGTSFVDAFAGCDASVGLVLGSFLGLIATLAFYLARKVLKFTDCMACIPEGFRAMVPAIMILTFAWTLKAMTDSLGAAAYVGELVRSSANGLISLLPVVVFLIAIGLSFATGTSWGTFGILIPIVLAVFGESGGEIMIIAVSACMAGAVCGDHCSPISDTTIMSSAGAQCDHVNHVSTQLPYALLVAAVSSVFYVIAGFVRSAWIVLPIAIVTMVAVIYVIKVIQDKKKTRTKVGAR